MTAHRNLLANRMSFPWCFVAVSALALVPPASAMPAYNIVPLGLDDLEHTRINGYKYSEAYEQNEAGQVRGSSNRYNGGNADLGLSVWLYDGATTIDIGLTGAEHTRNDGYKYSYSDPYFLSKLNEAGQVSGYSNRYNGDTFLGQTAWLYDGTTTIDVGLTGSEHTFNGDWKFSDAYELNEAGQVSGYSNIRYSNGYNGGRSAWLYDGATTINIGLTGSEHTASGGYKYSDAYDLNEAGQVSGYSERYNGSVPLGQTAWLYDGTTTIDVGLTGAEHTASNGAKSSFANQLNEAGQVRGGSLRFNGGGRSAWLYDGATTINIGLTGAEHTRNDGYKDSFANQLNEAGHVYGWSFRYNGGSTDLGQTAWLYDGATTIAIGLTGAEHTRNDGYKYSSAAGLNEAGQISGYSKRYNGGNADLGQTAWLYDGATTIDIGLTGAEHTRNDGHKYSSAAGLNEAGQISGYSKRYNGGNADLGQTAWLYDGAITIDIGLTGAEHTRNDGHKYSSDARLNEAGQVIGYSNRYNGGSADLGRTAWLYDGATTIAIGLTGAEHTRNDGYKDGFAYGPNEAGQVFGLSYRYNGGSADLGQDAWLYDPLLGQTFTLNLSTRSDGYAFSSPGYLGDDGLVLGTYTLFDALDNDLGHRAFYFTIADGLHDLGSLVEGGLAANGWDWLAYVIRVNGLKQIRGVGKLTSQSAGEMAYLLTPAVVVGDYNGDGSVDAADYVVWRKSPGNFGGDPGGYNTWRAHFGRTSGSGLAMGSISNSAVPEPGGLALVMLAASALLRRSRCQV